MDVPWGHRPSAPEWFRVPNHSVWHLVGVGSVSMHVPHLGHDLHERLAQGLRLVTSARRAHLRLGSTIRMCSPTGLRPGEREVVVDQHGGGRLPIAGRRRAGATRCASAPAYHGPAARSRCGSGSRAAAGRDSRASPGHALTRIAGVGRRCTTPRGAQGKWPHMVDRGEPCPHRLSSRADGLFRVRGNSRRRSSVGRALHS